MPEDHSDREHLAGHALAIGWICIEWAKLESVIDSLLAFAIPLDDGHIENAVLGNADLRQKIQMLLAVAHQKQVSNIWFEKLRAALNHVDNDLRVERNRAVHDYWLYLDKPHTIYRISTKTILKKQQSFKPTTLETQQFNKIPLETINQTVNRIVIAYDAIEGLRQQYIRHSLRKK